MAEKPVVLRIRGSPLSERARPPSSWWPGSPSWKTVGPPFVSRVLALGLDAPCSPLLKSNSSMEILAPVLATGWMATAANGRASGVAMAQQT